MEASGVRFTGAAAMEAWSPEGELVELPVVGVELAASGPGLVVDGVTVRLPDGTEVDSEELAFSGWGFHRWVAPAVQDDGFRQADTIRGVVPAELLAGDTVAELGGRMVVAVDASSEPAVVVLEDGTTELVGGEAELTVRRLRIYGS